MKAAVKKTSRGAHHIPEPRSVIAVDPGYDRIGIAIFDEKNLLHSECFIPDSKIFTERILAIKHHLETLIASYHPACLALETLFFNNNQKTALKVAEARGVITVTALECGIPVHEYSPQAVKIAVTGRGNADKTSVMKMVEKLVILAPKKRHDDELDAVALGIAHQALFRFSQSLSTP